MPQVKIFGRFIEVDIKEEIARFPWTKPKWSEEKLTAASPFRYESRPSFFVDLRNGGFHDSGAFDDDCESGSFVKLLSFLRDETYEETCEYLIKLYDVPTVDENGRVVIPSISLRKEKERVSLDESRLKPHQFRHQYLANRGINERTQRFMGVGYSKASRSITLPWRHPDGVLANIKYRKIQGKVFWYEQEAAPVKTLVYGIDKVHRHGLKTATVCDAEIDALSWYTSGIPAIALGGSAVTKEKLDIIRKSPIETLIVAMDNDKVGAKMRRQLAQGLQGYMTLKYVEYPAEYKDANESLVNSVDLSKLGTYNLDNFFDGHINK